MSGNSSSFLPFGLVCLLASPGYGIFISFVITIILLLLPLCIFTLHHGLQQWRQRKRSTSSAATVSHFDCFTYHLVVMELVGVCGFVLVLCGIKKKDDITIFVATLSESFTWFGQTSFHVLTCVERYLAVVHPVTYLSLRNQRGIRIRNISISCVWMFCFAGTGLLRINNSTIVINLSTVLVSLTIISFCSVSVLCVLIHPGPGEQGGGRERLDQSKQRAFFTIMTILGVLVLRFAWNIFWAVKYVSIGDDCVMLTCQFWFNLPSSLVLPLLFLQRAGKLDCWKKNIQ